MRFFSEFWQLHLVSPTLPQLQRDHRETLGTKEMSVQAIKAFSTGITHQVPFLSISLTASIKSSHVSPTFFVFKTVTCQGVKGTGRRVGGRQRASQLTVCVNFYFLGVGGASDFVSVVFEMHFSSDTLRLSVPIKQ